MGMAPNDRTKSKPSEHALAISELLLHDSGVGSQVLEKLVTAAKGWGEEASGAQYWLYMLDHRSWSTGLLGLNSLQGRDNAVLQLLTDLEGMGLLDAYLVNVEHYEYRGGCIGNASSYDLASVDHCVHAIGSWMRLDGSNPCFSDMKEMDIDECVVQVHHCSSGGWRCVCFNNIESDPHKVEVADDPEGYDNIVGIERYWSRPALIFWPPSCRWKIHCQAGLQHCIETLQHFVGKAAELPVLSASNHPAKYELSQQNATLPEMAHTHTASQNNIREDQDAYKLAAMMWAIFEMQLLRHPNNLHAYMQLVERLSLQSLASQIVGTLCKQRQGLDPITVSALLSVLDLVPWEIICKCVKDMALHMAQVVLCEYETLLQGFNVMLVFQDGMQNIQEGGVHKTTFDMAVTLAHLAVKAKPGGDGVDTNTQQGLVLTSVKAFSRCFATPGSHQHIGLQDAYDDLIEMFTHRQKPFPVDEVLGPACAQMANPKDNIKLARSPALLKLMAHCMTDLQKLTAHPPTWTLNLACPARSCKFPQLCQEILVFLQDPESCVCQVQTDTHGWRHFWGWIHRHDEEIECDAEQSEGVFDITCIKTAEWHDMRVQRYCRQCAWLTAITEATKQGILLLVLRQAQTRPPRR